MASNRCTSYDAEWLEYDDDTRPSPFKCSNCGGMVPGSHPADALCPYCGSQNIVEKDEDDGL